MGSDVILETEDLTKEFAGLIAVNGVSLSIDPGEMVGYIGANGAGKSTTIRLLLSLIHPTSGSGKVFGKDVVTYGPEIRRDIGYLPSEVYYYEGMKVIDGLASTSQKPAATPNNPFGGSQQSNGGRGRGF